RELAIAQRRQKEEARRQQQREDNRRFRDAMLKAKQPGRDGKRRLGRESGVLLDKIKRMVGEA
ncbi:hypothetical protein KEM52_004318, partial [Ascosphaera acerosa]